MKHFELKLVSVLLAVMVMAVLAVAGLASSLVGCQTTVPEGWDSARVPQINAVRDAALPLFSNPLAGADASMVVAIAKVGASCMSESRTTSTDTNARALQATTFMDEYAKSFLATKMAGRTVPEVARSVLVIGAGTSDTEVYLGLIRAARASALVRK